MTSASKGHGKRCLLRRLAVLLTLVTSGCAHGHATATTDQPASPTGTALYEQGVSLARSGDLLRSEQYLSLALRAGYPERRVLPWLLDLCLSASRYRAALGYAEAYLDRNPDDRRLRRLVDAIRAALLGRQISASNRSPTFPTHTDRTGETST